MKDHQTILGQWGNPTIARLLLAWLSLAAVPGWTAFSPAAEPAAGWVEPMSRVHARFTGTRGTLALFGDSITVSLAFWAPLEGNPKGMSPVMTRAHQTVQNYMKSECWRQWRGPAFGNEGRMTIRWAYENVDRWLKKLNPEVAVVMFGSNDVGDLGAPEYEEKMREVVRRCLTNGTIVLLTTMPPRSGRLDKSKQFADIARKLAREEHVPLVDYFAAVLERRPDDWDGALPKFKQTPGDEYQVPTLIARDGVHPSNPRQFGDYSEGSLRQNGFALRNYVTLLGYAAVIENVLQPGK
jgi:lysophospholipase L1-like esterase